MPPKLKLRRGDVVLMPFPFADLSAQKVRPAVVISADPQDAEMIFAFVTSVLTNHSPRGAEVMLMTSNSEFSLSGLKVDSIIGWRPIASRLGRQLDAGWFASWLPWYRPTPHEAGQSFF